MFTNSEILQPDKETGYTYFKSKVYPVYFIQFYTETEFGDKICKALDNNDILRKAHVRFPAIWQPVHCNITNYFYNIFKNELMIEIQVNDNLFDDINSYSIINFVASYEEPHGLIKYFRMSLDIFLMESII